MDDEWSRLQSYQHLQGKLFMQLGPTEYGTDDTVLACRELIDLDPEDRSKFIVDRWGAVTDEVQFLLGQLERLEQMP